MLIEIMMVTAFVSFAILIYTTETGLFGAACTAKRANLSPSQLTRPRNAAMMLPSVANRGADVLKPVRPRCLIHCCQGGSRCFCETPPDSTRTSTQRFVSMNVLSGLGVATISWLFVALLRQRRILHI